jgi:Zn-dependent protease with chaperone function
MKEQNYSNHRRLVKGYHYVLIALLFIGLLSSIVNVFRHRPYHGGFLSSILLVLLFVCLFLMTSFLRTFPLKAQDRAIRAEEGLRYFILTRKPIDSRISIGQIAALRFAPDDELIPLVDRVVAENLSPDDIKKAIKNWRSDHHRV